MSPEASEKPSRTASDLPFPVCRSARTRKPDRPSHCPLDPLDFVPRAVAGVSLDEDHLGLRVEIGEAGQGVLDVASLVPGRNDNASARACSSMPARGRRTATVTRDSHRNPGIAGMTTFRSEPTPKKCHGRYATGRNLTSSNPASRAQLNQIVSCDESG